jgi:hypothetical protein
MKKRMKRHIFGLFFILIISTGMANGQAALLVLIFGDKVATENFHFSLKLGATYSMIHGYEEGTNGWSLNFGLVNNIRIGDRLWLTPEFLPLAVRSIKDVPVLTTGNADLDDLLVELESTDRRLNYIDIPVLLKADLTRRISLSAGPQLSVLLNATDVYKSSPIQEAVLTTELDISSALRTLDIGGVIDLHIKLVEPVGGKGVNLFLRYGQGFRSILKDKSGPRYTSSVIQFGATFPFVAHSEEPE